MKFFRKKIVSSIAIVSVMSILSSPISTTVNASIENTFTVVQGNKSIGTYDNRSEAIVEARRWAGSEVLQGQDTIWKFGDNLYRVIQGSANLAVYESKEEAVKEAVKWAGSEVLQGQNTVWKFGDHLYRVVQGSADLGLYGSREEAIKEAVKWAGSEIIQEQNTVWRFGDHLYTVVQGDAVIGSYTSVNAARAEVRKWNGARIIQNGEIVETINFSRPTNGRVSSGFGPRWGRMHNGIDIAAPTGTPIVASDSGVVTEVTYEPSGYGRKVVIDHQNGYKTLYAHASRTHVRVGQVVSAGDTIASVGSTGRSTGPHLHFEIIENGRRVDPQRFL